MRAVAFVLVLAGLLMACGDDGGEVEGLPTVDGAPEIRIEADDFSYAPARFTATAGAPVNVVLTSVGGGHNLSVADAGFRLPLVDEGETTRGALTLQEPGTYTFVCTVPGHLEQGMQGTIEVQ